MLRSSLKIPTNGCPGTTRTTSLPTGLSSVELPTLAERTPCFRGSGWDVHRNVDTESGVRPIDQAGGDQVRTADVIVFAGTVADRQLSWKWRQFFDRSFFNTHTPSLAGKQIAFLVAGPLSQLPDMREQFMRLGWNFSTPIWWVLSLMRAAPESWKPSSTPSPSGWSASPMMGTCGLRHSSAWEG